VLGTLVHYRQALALPLSYIPSTAAFLKFSFEIASHSIPGNPPASAFRVAGTPGVHHHV
jgi:hypothetical protein